VQTAPSVQPAAPVVAKLRVTNESDVLWRSKGLANDQYALRVGCRWIDSAAPNPTHDYQNRFDFPYDVTPGDSVAIVATLNAPSSPGAYTLECDAVQELVHWFHSMGSPVGTAPVTVAGGGGPAIEGFLDRADNEMIAGWVWEKDYPNRPVQLEIYDGDVRLATVAAGTFRQDLRDAGKGNGAHSFSFTPHFKVLDGKPHMIRVVAAGKNFELAGSPRTLKEGP